MFQVARSEQVDKEKEDDNYLDNDGVQFQTEWLPVEGTATEFFYSFDSIIRGLCAASI